MAADTDGNGGHGVRLGDQDPAVRDGRDAVRAEPEPVWLATFPCAVCGTVHDTIAEYQSHARAFAESLTFTGTLSRSFSESFTDWLAGSKPQP